MEENTAALDFKVASDHWLVPLNHICRLCAERAQSAQEMKKNVDHSWYQITHLIYMYRRIDVVNHQNNVHAKKLCNSCYKYHIIEIPALCIKTNPHWTSFWKKHDL